MVPYKVSTVDPVVLKKLQAIDWKTILYNLASSNEGRKFTPMQTILAILRYSLFLILAKKYPNVRMVPSKEIDVVLHAHIATASQFQKDCQNLFGVSLVHSPGLGTRGETDRQEWLLAFAYTRKLFEQNFGKGTMGNSVAACCEVIQSSM